MSVREYIGARYVPLFANPIEWDSTKTYEPLTVVYYQGNSYTSRQAVPVGISIENETYWAITGNYNAQIEQYRQEVQTFDGRIDDLEDKFDSNGKLATNVVVTNSITDSSITSAKILDGTIATADIANNAITSAKIADGTIVAGDIASNAITTAKIADSNVTAAKLANGSVTTKKLAHDEVIVIFGDSWSANDVAASTWYESIQTMFGNATIHNYAVNGCHSSNGSFATMYQAFVNDTSWDKTTITRAILVYGVNDFFTYPIPASQETQAIKGFYDAVKNLIPSHVPIHWFINHCYAKEDYGAILQMYYWHDVTVNINNQCPRLIPHETWSWFNYTQYNSENRFHIVESASRGLFANNIYKCMCGGEPEKLVTYRGSYNNDLQIVMDVKSECVELTLQWASTTSVKNYYRVQANPVYLPQLLAQMSFATPEGQFCKFETRSTDSTNVDQITFVASANTSSTSNTLLTVQYTLYPTY